MNKRTKLTLELNIVEQEDLISTHINIYRNGEFIGVKQLTSLEAEELFESVQEIKHTYEEETK
jgi:hypothetical protein